MTPEEVAALSPTALRASVLEGIARGRPVVGPQQVHIDLTNTCNAACVTCWDHSPHLDTPRPASWKRQRLPLSVVLSLLEDLEALGSVRAVVISGMGDPLTHPHVYEVLTAVKQRGWHLTLLTNLVGADLPRLAAAGIDNLLVGVQGVTPDTHSAFHPGWSETEFFRMCSYLRGLRRAGVSMRHVQVIDTHTAAEVVQMVRFAQRFGAQRVNYKLASLAQGTEVVACTPAQLRWLDEEALPEAEALAASLGVQTNLELFRRQVAAARAAALQTTDMDSIGCFMGYAYTRITVEQTVLFCCNTNVVVGRLEAGRGLAALWEGPRWQALRERLAARQWFEGCERCGKYEQNVKWAARVQARSRASAAR